MDDVLEALAAPDRAIRRLIEECGASRLDLKEVGLTDYTARKHLQITSPRALAPTEAVQIAPLGPRDVVALVAMSQDVGRRFLSHGVYIRDALLHGQIRLSAKYLGYSKDGTLEAVRPITGMWRLGSAQAIPMTGIVNLAAVMAEPDLNDNWPGPATLVELGPPVPLGLPLGFALSANGAKPALRKVRHVLLDDLLSAVQKGSTFVDVPRL
ncbi:hypothetical protein [Embleya sp. NPDC059237]|uniref:hypothetical protein n=1 Tax=Embleya sp. NPDC059237 TaxID=3346784 RepID=UPI0036981665